MLCVLGFPNYFNLPSPCSHISCGSFVCPVQAAPAPKEPSEKQLGRRRMTIMTQFGEVGADFGDDKAKENIPDNIKYGAA